MSRLKTIATCAAAALLASTAWQIAACELAYYELREDLNDIAALGSTRLGWTAPKSDDDLRATIIEKARAHDIVLNPNQILVRHFGTPEYPQAYLVVDYKEHIAMPGFSLIFHFHPTGGKRP